MAFQFNNWVVNGSLHFNSGVNQMITEEKLAELRKAYPVSPADYGEIIMGKITLLYIFDTLSALWRVAKAAEGLFYEGTPIANHVTGEPEPYRWNPEELKEALAALREGKETR